MIFNQKIEVKFAKFGRPSDDLFKPHRQSNLPLLCRQIPEIPQKMDG